MPRHRFSPTLLCLQHWRRYGISVTNAFVTTALVFLYATAEPDDDVWAHKVNSRITETTLGYFVYDTVAMWTDDFGWARWEPCAERRLVLMCRAMGRAVP